MYESGNSAGASNRMHLDLLFAKAPDRPSLSDGHLIKGCIPTFAMLQRMPVIPIGLDNQPNRLEHEVGLEASKHRLVHLELQPALLELIAQEALDQCVLLRQNMAQSGLAHLLTAFKRRVEPQGIPFAKAMFVTNVRLPSLLSRFRRYRVPKAGKAYLLSMLCRKMFPKVCSTQLLTFFRFSPTQRRRLPFPFECFWGVFTTKINLAQFFSMFWCLVTTRKGTHFMFNYNTLVVEYV